MGENRVAVHFRSPYLHVRIGLVIECASSSGLGGLVGAFGSQLVVGRTFGREFCYEWFFFGNTGMGLVYWKTKVWAGL